MINTNKLVEAAQKCGAVPYYKDMTALENNEITYFKITESQLQATFDAVNASQGEAFAYLYHDATYVRKVDPLIHSTMFSFNKLNGFKNETKLYLAPPQVNDALDKAIKIAEDEACLDLEEWKAKYGELNFVQAIRALKG